MPNLQARINELKKAGKPNSEIIENLKKEGHLAQDIYDAMSTNESLYELTPPTPSEEMGSESMDEDEDSYQPMSGLPETGNFIPSQKFPAPSKIPQRQSIEEIEEIAESIISEKIDELSVNINDISLWREKTSSEIEAIKQEILRIRNHMENLQATMLGKVEDYRKSITDVSIEVKTLSKVLEKILQPLTENVKELSRITERLKK
ncbi:hypothetical protein J4443_03550 [Candidatus Woesearchaeota archaeon]|nr:hypothetical protein [Candidatus Woesearchaeota archaeon]